MWLGLEIKKLYFDFYVLVYNLVKGDKILNKEVF